VRAATEINAKANSSAQSEGTNVRKCKEKDVKKAVEKQKCNECGKYQQ